MSQKKKRKRQKNKTSTGRWLKKVKQKRYLVGLEFTEHDEVEVTARNEKEAIQKALESDDAIGVCGMAEVDFVEEIQDGSTRQTTSKI